MCLGVDAGKLVRLIKRRVYTRLGTVLRARGRRRQCQSNSPLRCLLFTLAPSTRAQRVRRRIFPIERPEKGFRRSRRFPFHHFGTPVPAADAVVQAQGGLEPP